VLLATPPVRIDVSTLIGRDHQELDLGLSAIADGRVADAAGSLDGLRLGFAAHAEACHTVYRTAFVGRPLPAHLAALFGELDSAHRAQEASFARVAAAPDLEKGARARALRDMIRQHNDYEKRWCLPLLRARLTATDFTELAPTYATERLRALAWTWLDDKSVASRALGS
jgi:hypothetical protein